VDFDGATGSGRVTVTGPDGEDLGDEHGRWVNDGCDDGFQGSCNRDPQL